MPALPSSLISPLSCAPAAAAVLDTAAGLPAAPAGLPDPRSRRGGRIRPPVSATEKPIPATPTPRNYLNPTYAYLAGALSRRSRADAWHLIDSGKWAKLRRVPTTADFEGMLYGVALRATRPRVAVPSAVHDHSHADTDSIIDVVREDLDEVSAQAVHDVLRALTAAALVQRFSRRAPWRTMRRGLRTTTTTTSSVGRAVPLPMSTARSAAPPALRPPTTGTTRSMKPRPSIGADVPGVSRQILPPSGG
jgi:hypothetical protein